MGKSSITASQRIIYTIICILMAEVLGSCSPAKGFPASVGDTALCSRGVKHVAVGSRSTTLFFDNQSEQQLEPLAVDTILLVRYSTDKVKSAVLLPRGLGCVLSFTDSGMTQFFLQGSGYGTVVHVIASGLPQGENAVEEIRIQISGQGAKG